MERRRKLAVALVVLSIVAYVGGFLIRGGTNFAGWIDSACSAACCFAAGITCLWAAKTRTGSSRRGWSAVGAGLWMWAAGDTVSLNSDAQGAAEFPHLVDVLWLSAIPILLFGLTSLLASQLLRVSARLALDGVVIAGSFFLVSWVSTLDSVASKHQSALEMVIALAYPVTDVMMASIVLLVIGASGATDRTALALLSSGFLVTAAGDTAYALLDRLGDFEASDAVNTVWFTSYALMLLGGVWAATQPVAERPRVTVPSYVLLPYIPLFIGLTTSTANFFVNGELDRVVAGVECSLVILVLIRQLVVLQENKTLNEQLEATVAELRLREAELRHRAYHDGLTDLPNRAYFHARVEEALAEPGANPALLYVDLDGFKPVNDQFGHAIGDVLLRIVAARLRECAAPEHTVARLGGDEFAILIPSIPDPSASIDLATRVVRAIASVTAVEGRPVTIGASVGVAVNQAHGVGELLRAADLAMYAAKAEGKGRYALVDGEQPHLENLISVHPV